MGSRQQLKLLKKKRDFIRKVGVLRKELKYNTYYSTSLGKYHLFKYHHMKIKIS